MQLLGEWYLCDDGTVRPTIVADVRTGERVVPAVRFVIDTAADRSVLTADLRPFLPAPTAPSASEGLAGLGGSADFALVRCELEFPRDGMRPVVVRGEYAVLTGFGVVDMPVLGRDVIDHFDLIVSRRSDTVTMLGGNHSFSVLG